MDLGPSLLRTVQVPLIPPFSLEDIELFILPPAE
jgi:hypothetical protein